MAATRLPRVLSLLVLVAACGRDRPQSLSDDEILALCADYCDALETCGIGISTCAVDCADALRATDEDVVRACDEDLHAFRGGCADFEEYMRASDACQEALTAPAGEGEGESEGPSDPMDACASYIDCVREVEPTAAMGASAAYGPDGACWTTEPEDVCRRACLESLEALHELHDDTPACAMCGSDADCGGDTPACSVSEGECVECTADTHCPGSRPGCDRNTSTCVACTEDAHCAAPTPACSLSTHRCVECTEDEHCEGSTPGCDVGTHSCVECTRSEHCPDDWTCSEHECCEPEACVDGVDCGVKDDGCGHAANCGSCDHGDACREGACETLSDTFLCGDPDGSYDEQDDCVRGSEYCTYAHDCDYSGIYYSASCSPFPDACAHDHSCGCLEREGYVGDFYSCGEGSDDLGVPTNEVFVGTCY